MAFGNLPTFGGTKNASTKPSSTGFGGPAWPGVPAPSAPRANPFGPIINTINTQYGPEIQGFKNTNDRLNALLPFQQTQYQNDQGNLRTNTALDLRGLDVDRAELGINRGSNQRDAAYYDKLLALMPQYRGLSKSELDNTIAQAQAKAQTEQRGINSDYTSRGAFLAPFRRMDISDSEKARLAAEQSANIGYQRDQLGLTEKELGLGRSRSGVDDENQKLDLAAQRIGISADKLRANLDQGLSQLGYSNFINVNDLLSKIDSNNLQQSQLARQIMSEILAAGGAYNEGQIGDLYESMFG